jgi:hypothetical protein
MFEGLQGYEPGLRHSLIGIKLRWKNFVHLAKTGRIGRIERRHALSMRTCDPDSVKNEHALPFCEADIGLVRVPSRPGRGLCRFTPEQ